MLYDHSNVITNRVHIFQLSITSMHLSRLNPEKGRP